MEVDGLPAWVEQELWNWSRWCWDGEWPIGTRPADPVPTVCDYPPREGEYDECQDAPAAICYDHAIQVNAAYETLPLVERRVIQAEYPRRREYGDLLPHQRRAKACRVIGINEIYYRIALADFKKTVWRMFA